MTLALRSARIPDSPVARWDTRWKLAALVVCAIGTATLRSPLFAAVALLAAIAIAALARLPRRDVIGRLVLVGLAVLPFLLIVPFTLDPTGPGWDIGPLRLSERGLNAAFGVVLRALAIGTFALILLGTAPPPRTFAAAHALRMQGVLVQVTQLAHRYATVLSDEARRVRIALRTRGFRAGTNSHTYRTLGHAVGGLLVRGGDRADQVAAAMRCRGFDGTYRTTMAFRTTLADVLSFFVAVAGTMALVIADRFLEW